MDQRITRHLAQMINRGSDAVERQYRWQPLIGSTLFPEDDSLGEETRFSPVKGLVHKFGNRVLWKVSYRCVAHCQFCTRSRQIGSPQGDLSADDIRRALDYITATPQIDEVILSGGDPFATPRVTANLLHSLFDIRSVKVIRLGTRVPLQAPQSLSSPPMRTLLSTIRHAACHRPIFILVNAQHPDELTPQVHCALHKLRQTGASMLSQTVFLRGVNDDVDVLADLFRSLYYLGVIPYYIYRCDYVRGLERFVCPIEREQRIMTELRRRLSGIAVPTYVVDVPGRGKIPVPLAFWDGTDLSHCRDFDDQVVAL